jgi:hypothetical protein
MSVGTFNRIALDVTGESTYGDTTGAITVDKSYPVRADRPVINVETVNDQDTLIGALENGLQSIVTKVTATQTIEMDARLDALATFGKFGFGKLSSSTVSAPYTHTITVGSSATERALPSFVHFFGDALNSATTNMWQFAGTKVSRLTIAGEAGGKVTMSVDLMSGKPVNATTGAQIETAITPPAFLGLAVDPILAMARVSTFSIGGTSFLNQLKSFEFVFENVFDEAAEMAAGSIMVPAMERIGFNVSGSFTLKADTAAGSTALINSYLTKIDTATLQGIQTLPEIILAIGGGKTGHSVTVTVRAAALADGSVAGQRGKLEKPFTFTGMYDVGDSEAARLVVINDQATYT